LKKVGSDDQVLTLLIVWQGSLEVKLELSNWFFLGPDFATQAISVETVSSCVFFVFESLKIQHKHHWSECRIINYLILTKLALAVLGTVLALGPFCMDLHLLSPYCHNLEPIFPSAALTLG